MLDLIMYTASDIHVSKNDPLGFSGSVVKNLEKYLGGKHILYIDNDYTSSFLAKYLLELAAVGQCTPTGNTIPHIPPCPGPNEVTFTCRRPTRCWQFAGTIRR